MIALRIEIDFRTGEPRTVNEVRGVFWFQVLVQIQKHVFPAVKSRLGDIQRITITRTE